MFNLESKLCTCHIAPLSHYIPTIFHNLEKFAIIWKFSGYVFGSTEYNLRSLGVLSMKHPSEKLFGSKNSYIILRSQNIF